MTHCRLSAIALLTLAGCAEGKADPSAEPWSFATAADTIVLQERDDHVVGDLTDLLEWREALIVVDGMELNLKAYDTASGELLWVLGRAGDGPGEFRSLAGAAVTLQDELAVLDPLSRRVTLFSVAGEVRTSWVLPGAFSGGIDVLPDGDLLVAGRVIKDRVIVTDSALHRFSPDGEAIRSYFVLQEAVHYGEAAMNGMKGIVVDSAIIGLQHTTNTVLVHGLSSGGERTDSLGRGFYRPITWALEPKASEPAYQSWIREQMITWWLRDMDEHVYTAGFQLWVDSLADWRVRWVFATPDGGEFAESEVTDAHPAFIRAGRLHSVGIRPDGRTELIVGRPPEAGSHQRASDGSLTSR